MKFLGLIKDPKDITTKEYVDTADNAIKESTKKALDELDNSKLDSDDMVGFTAEEIQALWNAARTKKSKSK